MGGLREINTVNTSIAATATAAIAAAAIGPPL